MIGRRLSLKSNPSMPTPPDPAWRRSRFEHGPDLKLFRPRFDWMINPRNGHEEKMIVLEGIDSVQVVGVTPGDEVLLVRQYRFGIGEYTLELPGGLIDAGEAPLAAAERELREETGWAAADWRPLGKHASNPVFMDNYIYTFAATGLYPAAEQSLDPGEDVEVVTMPVGAVRERLIRGDFIHPHTVCGLLAFFGQL
jgi:8-oxo-dGTP pyrophosphatase MutT (NUDIX family)